MSEGNSSNLIVNSNFSDGNIRQVPINWKVKGPRQSLTPQFELVSKEDRNMLMISGNQNDNCVGCISQTLKVKCGKTYHMKVKFQVSEDVNPYNNLLVQINLNNGFNNGIFHLKRLDDKWLEGENYFFIPGEEIVTGEINIYFKLSGRGRAWVQHVYFAECESIPQRNVDVACVEGAASLEMWGRVLDSVGSQNVDLVLLPETFNSTRYEDAEPLNGSAATLMSQKAKQYSMYVAGTFYHMDESKDCIYNTGLLFDRNGEMLGRYDKNHPYSQELLNGGVTPGTEIPVFETDFGTVGIMICYDSWFTDVAELLALKGAEIILFPSMGYYQSIMPARASDNCVRIVASSQDSPLGIWDTSGAEVRNPVADPTRHANCENTFSNVREQNIEGIKILIATLDLSQSPSPHNWGGPMLSAPGGRLNRREQKELLLDQIKAEMNRL